MYARQITVSSLALVFSLALAGLAGATDSKEAAPEAATECCQHKDRAEGAGHCDHRAKGKAGDGKACRTKHEEMKKDGAQGEGCCCCSDACENGEKKPAPAKS